MEYAFITLRVVYFLVGFIASILSLLYDVKGTKKQKNSNTENLPSSAQFLEERNISVSETNTDPKLEEMNALKNYSEIPTRNINLPNPQGGILRNAIFNLKNDNSKSHDLIKEQTVLEDKVSLMSAELERYKALGVKFREVDKNNKSLENTVSYLNSELEGHKKKHEDMKSKLAKLSQSLFSTEVERDSIRAEFDKHVSKLQSENASLREILASKTKEISEAQKLINMDQEQTNVKDLQIEELMQRIHYMELIRRKLHNDLEDEKGRMRVYLRIRPAEYGDTQIIKPDMVFENVITLQEKNYYFDRIYGPDCAQEVIYNEISPLIQSVFDGVNVCIFTFGQTGSGKTFTMEGERPQLAERGEISLHPDSGIIPRALNDIFVAIKDYERIGWNYELRISCIEVYNEKIYDLLRKEESQALVLKRGADCRLMADGQNVEILVNIEQAYKLLDLAKCNRSKAANLVHNNSSRSHLLFQIFIEGIHNKTKSKCSAILNLVDLAGSEADKDSDELSRKKEGCHIRKSLLELAIVLQKINQGITRPSCRGSKLTYLLEDSLCDGSKTVMIINTANRISSLAETKRNIEFGSKLTASKSRYN